MTGMADFYRGVGIENCWIPQEDSTSSRGKRLLDIHLQMQHYQKWEEDLKTAAALGINAIRYSVPWYVANPKPDSFDWTWIDKPIRWLIDRGIIPVIDLLHYGTPVWMENAILNESFPDRFGAYAEAFIRHYEGAVDHFTPVNEPQTSAMLSGYHAHWPPYLAGIDGWARLGKNLAKAMIASSRLLRSAGGRVTLISADCYWSPAVSEIKEKLAISQLPMDENTQAQLGYFPATLAYGKLPPDSALGICLARLGYSRSDLEWFVRHAAPPDLFGFNYYPNGWPDQEKDVSVKLRDMVARCKAAYRLFGLPVYVTETSGGMTDEQKVEWVGALRVFLTQMKSKGIPVRGMNWWPLYETIKWDYRDNGKTVEESIRPGEWNNGLYVIRPSNGDLRRVKTAAVAAYAQLLAELSG
jgi:beta-glucosidase/6-phospho-beta-glucosidase/beta-galactosidase